MRTPIYVTGFRVYFAGLQLVHSFLHLYCASQAAIRVARDW